MGWDNPGSDSPDAAKRSGSEMNGDFEQRLAGRISADFLSERKASRRWGIFFKLLTFGYVTIFVVMVGPGTWQLGPFGADKVAAIVDVRGIITSGSNAGADNVIKALQKAFKDKTTTGVIVRINSPGGSPVQAGYINDEISRLRTKYPTIPVYAVIEDICASGGYYVAAAADKIFAHEASIVGSIGVRMGNFGFVDAMEKLGIERRLITAGENKGLLDPFSPIDEEHLAHAKRFLGQVHTQFIDAVKEGRGDRLADNPDVFSGLFWTGEQSLRLGLIDEFGSSDHVVREVIEAERTIDYTTKDYSLTRILEHAGADLLGRVFGGNSGLL